MPTINLPYPQISCPSLCCVVLTEIASAQWATHGELQQFTAMLTFLALHHPPIRPHLRAHLPRAWYRDVYPLATYTKAPMDLPLTVPWPYVPVDPATSNLPNKEQTTSLLSFLDRMIYAAKKMRGEKFAYEDLPTLADYCSYGYFFLRPLDSTSSLLFADRCRAPSNTIT
ncbi:hypothetical protein DFH06DRAFT_1411791 [Mycena polygramma]|nr:hypothetical protein DFH06DRAFT_1411791 [Mycena polygramma]